MRIIYLFDSIFQRKFGLISYSIFMKKFISLTMVAMEIGKANFSLIIATVATRKKNFIKNLYLIDSKNHS